MTTYPVNELFETIQGEATYTGTPAVFVRLMGCQVGCLWCDTKHTWRTLDATKVSPAVVLSKTGDSDSWCEMTSTQIAALVDDHQSTHVVITGGEPCAYDLRKLTAELLATERTVQIETSGTYEVKAHPDTWVTVSPKVGMPGKRELRLDALQRANEIKWPIGREADVALMHETLAAVHKSVYMLNGGLWLQPLSQSDAATRLCIRTATDIGCRVSIQTHRYAGVR
jgi:7-carboxy-7-deazaguanine synthase